MPGRVGMVAGMVFGFSFGLGGLGAAALGQIADMTSIETVYQRLLLPAADRLADRAAAEHREAPRLTRPTPSISRWCWQSMAPPASRIEEFGLIAGGMATALRDPTVAAGLTGNSVLSLLLWSGSRPAGGDYALDPHRRPRTI